MTAFVQNRRMVRTYAADPYVKGRELDVAFVGESLVEMMDGRWLGRTVPQLREHRQAFASRFRGGDSGTKHEGIALGIAGTYGTCLLVLVMTGTVTQRLIPLPLSSFHNTHSLLSQTPLPYPRTGDTAPNVLYRLMHGEMEKQFDPKVWWLVLGMNDLARMRCSEEVVVIGILRVVEEILEARPNARIVLNSLLPMEYSRGGPVALLHDYEDVTQQRKDAFQRHKEITGVDEKDGWRRTRYQRLLRQRKKKNKSGNVLTQGGGGTRPKGTALSPEVEAEEDEEREQAFEEEVLKHEGKRARGHTDAVLDSERHTTREYNPLSVFTKKKQPPLWTSIYAINQELKKFAKNQPRVDYFDATFVFASSLGGSKYRLDSSRIDARGHPTAAGFRAWEDAIVRRLDEVLTVLRGEHPEIFSPLDQDDDSSSLPANDTYWDPVYMGDDDNIGTPEMFLPHDGPQGGSDGTAEGGDGDPTDHGGDSADGGVEGGNSADGASNGEPTSSNGGEASPDGQNVDGGHAAPDDGSAAAPSDAAEDGPPSEGENAGGGSGAEDHPEEPKPNPDEAGGDSTPPGGSEGGESPNETPPGEGAPNETPPAEGTTDKLPPHFVYTVLWSSCFVSRMYFLVLIRKRCTGGRRSSRGWWWRRW